MTSIPKVLHTSLCSLLVQLVFKGLVDLGFSDCFLDSVFMIRNKLPTWEIMPLPIALIDGTVNAYVTCIVSLPINLSCGYICIPKFYMTKLKSTYPAVLDYSWLVHCNSTIDWAEGTISCKKSTQDQLLQTSAPEGTASSSIKSAYLFPNTSSQLMNEPSPPGYDPIPLNPQTISQVVNKPLVLFINACAFQYTYKTKRSTAFRLSLNPHSLTSQTVIVGERDPDLSSILQDYWQFADIFCKQKTKTLPKPLSL